MSFGMTVGMRAIYLPGCHPPGITARSSAGIPHFREVFDGMVSLASQFSRATISLMTASNIEVVNRPVFVFSRET